MAITQQIQKNIISGEQTDLVIPISQNDLNYFETTIGPFSDIKEIYSYSLEWFSADKAVTPLITASFNFSDGTQTGFLPMTNIFLKEHSCKNDYTLSIRTRSGPEYLSKLSVSTLTLHGVPIIPEVQRWLSLSSENIGILSNDSTWKVFSLTGYDIIGEGEYTAEFSFTQDSGKSWSKWIPLNTPNITSLRVDPLKFFKIKFRITAISNMFIDDINLIGSFINVTKNYEKSPKIAIRLDCAQASVSPTADCQPENQIKLLLNQFAAPACDNKDYGIVSYDAQGNPLDKDGNVVTVPAQQTDGCSDTGFWNPYNFNEAIQQYELQAKSFVAIYCISVDYYKTNPDKKGRDIFLNEYQLFNIDQQCKIKIIVPQNQFPDMGSATFNPLDALFFDQFKIEILRSDLKSAFGIETRPEEWDKIFFCQRNQLYEVEHAYMHRDFMDSSIKWIVSLRKANNNLNMRPSTTQIKDNLEKLTKLSNIENLIGKEIKEEIKQVVNKEQFKPLSHDPLSRVLTGVNTVESDLENGSNIVATSYYDFSKSQIGADSITYAKADNNLELGEARSFYFWCYWDKRRNNTDYSVLSNLEGAFGYSIKIRDEALVFNINGLTYSQPLPLADKTWWCFVINLDQRYDKLQVYLYKRFSETEPSTGPGSAYYLSYDDSIDIVKSEFHKNGSLKTYGCADKFYLTNIRIFNSISPQEEHFKTINQTLVTDSRYLIMADNAEKKMRANKLRNEQV